MLQFSHSILLDRFKYKFTFVSPHSSSFFLVYFTLFQFSLLIAGGLRLQDRSFLFYETGSASFPAKMGSALLSELATEIVIPVCAVVGIVFSLVQWFLVSLVKLTPERHGPSSSPRNSKNGYGDYLIEEEEGINDHNVVTKCADIQSAISEGDFLL